MFLDFIQNVNYLLGETYTLFIFFQKTNLSATPIFPCNPPV